MKKRRVFPLLALCLSLLAGCGEIISPPPTAPPAPAPTATPSAAVASGHVLTACRIIDGAESGDLVLAGIEDDQVYTLSVKDKVVVMDGGSSEPGALRDGMLVHIGHTGGVLETYPAQFAGAKTIAGDSGDVHDLAGLYLRVLEDLWAVDSGLNEGITELGVDLSALEGFSDGEKAAMAYVFGMEHGLMPILGTWEELKDQGYFSGTDPDQDGLPAWEDGCLFTIQGNTESFQAEKWRTALGAYCFYQCAAEEKDGVWTYEIGSEIIA